MSSYGLVVATREYIHSCVFSPPHSFSGTKSHTPMMRIRMHMYSNRCTYHKPQISYYVFKCPNAFCPRAHLLLMPLGMRCNESYSLNVHLNIHSTLVTHTHAHSGTHEMNCKTNVCTRKFVRLLLLTQ